MPTKDTEYKPSRSKYISEHAPGSMRVEKGKPVQPGEEEGEQEKKFSGHSDKFRQYNQ